MVYGKVAARVLVGTVALSSSAAAQETRKLDLGFQAQVEHHSNVARANKSAAALRGLTRADTIFTPSFTVDFLAPVGRQSIFLRGAAGYSFYDKNDRLDRERFDITGGANGRLGPCTAVLTGGYTRGISQAGDPALIENVNNIQETQSIGLDVGCIREPGFGIVAAVSQDWTNNDLATLESSDSEQASAMVGVTYGRPALGTLTVFGNHQQTDYPKRIISPGYDLNSFGVTFERQFGARIQGSVTGAFATIDQRGVGGFGGDGDSETSTYSAALSFRASSRLRFEGLFDRSVTPSSAGGRSYDLTETNRVTGVYDVGSRITITAGAGRVNRDSRGVIFTPAIQLVESRTTNVFASLRYKQSERLSFILDAGREKRTTNAPQFDYTDDWIGLRADASF
jgi:hypothetical protein